MAVQRGYSVIIVRKAIYVIRTMRLVIIIFDEWMYDNDFQLIGSSTNLLKIIDGMQVLDGQGMPKFNRYFCVLMYSHQNHFHLFGRFSCT